MNICKVTKKEMSWRCKLEHGDKDCKKCEIYIKKNKITAFKELGTKYGFHIEASGKALVLSAKNTDGIYKQWLIYELGTGKTLLNGNTDNCNFWFGETRPDMTPDKIVQFVVDLNTALDLTGPNRFSVRELIDPEDWQEIAGVQDACEDERYAK